MLLEPYKRFLPLKNISYSVQQRNSGFWKILITNIFWIKDLFLLSIVDSKAIFIYLFDIYLFIILYNIITIIKIIIIINIILLLLLLLILILLLLLLSLLSLLLFFLFFCFYYYLFIYLFIFSLGYVDLFGQKGVLLVGFLSWDVASWRRKLALKLISITPQYNPVVSA